MLAEKQYRVYGRSRGHYGYNLEERSRHEPPSPILYPFFCGKAFMMIRLSMAYSNEDLGQTIDYFFYQELILIGLHMLISCVVLPQFSDNPTDEQAMNNMIVLVTLMDASK